MYGYAIPENDSKHSRSDSEISDDDIDSQAQQLDYGHDECLSSDEYVGDGEEFGAARGGSPLFSLFYFTIIYRFLEGLVRGLTRKSLGGEVKMIKEDRKQKYIEGDEKPRASKNSNT